jgi:hypothetical protein
VIEGDIRTTVAEGVAKAVTAVWAQAARLVEVAMTVTAGGQRSPAPMAVVGR